ncbi:MAG: helix-turn-helix domain-containing protein [Candidatus Acidiferrales bacterium]
MQGHSNLEEHNWLTMSSIFKKADDWISQAEAARLRGVSRQAIALLVKRGRLSVFRIGGRLLVNRQEVERFQPEEAGRPRNDKAQR